MAEIGDRLRAASHTTPGRYRLLSLAGALLLVIATVAGFVSASRMKSSTHRAETNSGPVLVATQQLVASMAEADAAATAAFLSGRDEDPEQRRLYEQALGRAGQQVEEIAALAGQDTTIRQLVGRITVQITQYAGLVEAARASNRIGSPDANGYLVSAVRLADRLVAGDVKSLAGVAQANLAHDESVRRQGFIIAVVTLLVALGVMGYAQLALMKTSRRILNLPLVAATLLVLVTLVWLTRASLTSADAFTTARSQGYDSIVITADLGTAGYGAKSAETLSLITSDPAQRAAADASAANVAPSGLIAKAADAADSPRERAAVSEVAARWQRYEDAVAGLRAAPNPAAAKAIAVGPASSNFNGFNFSVQSVLGQNRSQFLDGLTSAANDTNRVPTATLLLLIAALGATFWGFQLRINDYR